MRRMELLADINKFGGEYAGALTLLGIVLTLFFGLVVPALQSVRAAKAAKALHQPAPIPGRLAKAGLAVGRWFQNVVVRLRTDPDVAEQRLQKADARAEEAEGKTTDLVSQVSDLREKLAVKTQLNREAQDRIQELENSAAAASEEIERLNKMILQARGSNTLANQEAFAKMTTKPMPAATWKIRRAGIDLEFSNVGGGKATNVEVTTNFPKQVTLTGAYASEAGSDFRKYFKFEPAAYLTHPELEFYIKWYDEASRPQQESKKLVN